MSDLEYIEDYFSNSLAVDEKKAFEARCESDPAFAETVSFYLLSRQAAQDVLTENKRTAFIDQYHQLARDLPEEGTSRRSWFAYAAAAVAGILLVITYLTYVPEYTPQQLADAYIDENLTTLSTTMSGATDTLSLAIAAFNRGDYSSAQANFLSVVHKPELAAEATKYLGITYLQQGEYEKAIAEFNRLMSFTDLHTNPGKFYLAVTLMKRSADGDAEEAKELLQQVISGKLPGYQQASVWVDDL